MNRRTSLKAIAAMAASAGIQGQAPPPAINYRFQLTYQNEELRQKWVTSDTHTRVWAGIGATLKDPKTFPVHLFDAV